MVRDCWVEEEEEEDVGRENKGEGCRRRKNGWNLGMMGKWLLLLLVVVRNFGLVSAVSDNDQTREGKMEEIDWGQGSGEKQLGYRGQMEVSMMEEKE